MMQIQTVKRGAQWTVPSQSRPGVLYIVRMVDGRLSCDCDGGFFVGRCKHQTAVANLITTQTPSKLSPEARAWGLSMLTGGRQP